MESLLCCVNNCLLFGFNILHRARRRSTNLYLKSETVTALSYFSFNETLVNKNFAKRKHVFYVSLTLKESYNNIGTFI